MMNDILIYIILVLWPLIITNILHMLLVKFDFLSRLTIPISTEHLGENKTWRGFAFVPIVNGLILTLIALTGKIEVWNPFVLGFFLGFAYVLFEFPNSFLKRKLGIKSGEKSDKFKIIFSMFDKMDSAFGVAFVYFLLGFVNIKLAMVLFLFNSLIHAFLSYVLVLLKIKKSF